MCKNLTNIFHLYLEELGHVITSVICPGGKGVGGGKFVIYLGKIKGFFFKNPMYV
jgi:hypothetical protein